MNKIGRQFTKNFSYALIANLTTLLISILIILIVPKIIGIEEYGYWQLYLFYVSYVGLLQFGWNDGIYLRYGGREYTNLDKGLFFTQFWMLFIHQILISIVIILFSIFFIEIKDRQFVFIMLGINTTILGVRAMPLFILQATNKIQEYAKITLIDRILYLILTISVILIGFKKFEILIATDVVAKTISLLYAISICRDIIFQRISHFSFNLKETFENINAGIRLMLSNISSLLIIGTMRFGIERAWNIKTFGKISLTLSISSFILILINAIGVVLFPLLRRTNEEKYPSIYIGLREILALFLYGMLLSYFPLSYLLKLWLPKYSESLYYMALLFPLFIFEGKTQLLTNTFLKTIRREKLMFRINLLSLLISLIIAVITTVIFKDINFAVVSILFIVAFRSAVSEIFLSRIIGFKVLNNIIFEVIFTVFFIITALFLNSWLGLLMLLLQYLIYLMIKKDNIKGALVTFKSLTQT